MKMYMAIWHTSQDRTVDGRWTQGRPRNIDMKINSGKLTR